MNCTFSYVLTQPCAAPVQQKLWIGPIFNFTFSFFIDMLRYSFPQPHSPISYACKPEIFYEGWKLAAEILKSGMKCLCLQCYWKKDLWNHRFTMVPRQLWDPGVFFISNLLLCRRWTDSEGLSLTRRTFGYLFCRIFWLLYIISGIQIWKFEAKTSLSYNTQECSSAWYFTAHKNLAISWK